jgi:uncharacterized protein YndB with AHSA1/START domain
MNATIGKLNLEIPEDRPETIMSRTFNAPRDLVFMAHSSCEHMSKWWGPRSTSFISCEMDFVEGGTWRILVRDSDGNEAPFKGEFREIQAPERLTWTFMYDVAPFNEEAGVETFVFSQQDGQTTITATSFYGTFEAREAALATGMSEGAAETYDRLEEYAATLI